ncbi:hypothetical protein AB0J63_38630 [Streptosporangium canum]|uniref:hypothetical protein n=1 Tax=Streptosporangium canum TaxID=324952 RepID=UPI00342B2A63
MTITQRLPRPAVITVAIAAVLCLAAACPATPKACAATAVVSLDTPPEPITHGSYRDGAEEEDVPPEPITDGSYRDGAHDENDDSGDRGDKDKGRC